MSKKDDQEFSMTRPDIAQIERVLMSLTQDAVDAEAYAARVRIQVAVMAKEFGIVLPEPSVAH
jgi:hypothetical protein